MAAINFLKQSIMNAIHVSQEKMQEDEQTGLLIDKNFKLQTYREYMILLRK